MTCETQQQFDYRPDLGKMVLAFAICSGLGWFGWVTASANDKSLIINGLIELAPANATRFWFAITGVMAFGAVLSLSLAISSIINPQRILLVSDGLLAPKYFWQTTAELVPFESITSLSRYTINRQSYLKVVHARGSVTINAAKLESSKAFENLCSAIASSAPHAV